MTVLVVVGALLAPACGGGSDEAAAVECPVGAIAESGEPVEIIFWHTMTEDNKIALEQLADEFNAAQDDVIVTPEFQGSYEETLNKYLASVRSGSESLPDLVELEDTATRTMIDSGTVLPAQACVDAAGYDLSDFVDQALASYTVDDVLYAMPWNVSDLVLYYNKQVFEAAGLDPERPPETLEEIRDYSRQIVDAGAAPHGFALKLDPWWFERWISSAGEEYVDQDNGRIGPPTQVAFDSETGSTAFRWIEEMVAEGLALNTGAPRGNFDNLFAIGASTAPMTIDSSAALGAIRSALATGEFPHVTLGVGRFPVVADDTGGPISGGALYMVAGSEPAHQEAAWQFVRSLSEPEQQAVWAAATGYVPIRESATDLPEIIELWAGDPGYKVAYDQLLTAGPTAPSRPLIGPYREIRDVIIASWEAMLDGELSADEALQRAVEQSDAELQG